MDALIFGLVVVALAAYVAAPLYGPRRPRPDTLQVELHARREALMATLRDLELDRTSGLVSDEEYERQRRALETETADVLSRLSGD